MVMVNCCWGGVTWLWPPSFVWWWWDVSKGRGGIEGTHYDDDDDKYHHCVSLWLFMPSKWHVQLGDMAMVGVGDGGWLWFCQLTGDLGGC